MRTKMLCLSLIVLVAAVARVSAEEPSAATLRAKTIAPFIDELTVAVARVDISQLKLDPIFDEACSLVPDRAQEILTAQMTANMIREMFVSAGGKDVYAVVSLADVPREPLLVVVPLYEKTNEAMVKSMLMQAQLPVVERCGDVLIAGRKEVIERVKAIEPDCRPGLAPAFEAAGDTTIQLLVLPPKHTQRVVEEILPELPEAIGGGATTSLTRGFLWGAVGLSGPPKLTARVVVQSEDKQYAAKAQAKWGDVAKAVAKAKEVREKFPEVEELTSLVKPRIEGTQLIIDFDGADEKVREAYRELRARVVEFASEAKKD